MRRRLSVLAAGLLLPVVVSAQVAPLEDSSVAPPAGVPLPLLSGDSLAPMSPAALTCAAVPSGVVAWWRAQSNTVDTIGVNDALGDAATRFGGVSYMTGKVGAAFRFVAPRAPSGTNFLFVPPSADLDLGAGAGLTIEGWVKPETSVSLRPLVGWNDGVGNIGAGLVLDGERLAGYLADTNTLPVRRISFCPASGSIGTSAWHHVALTFDKAAGRAITYVDGVAVAQTNLAAFRPATKAPVYLGFMPATFFGTVDLHYAGGLDEFAIYNRALSAAELQAIVAADAAGKCVPPPPPPVPPPANIVGWWRGETNTLDSVDGNNGVARYWILYTNGIVGRAFAFYTGYLRVPAANNLNVGLGPGLTVETWVMPETAVGLFLSDHVEYIGWHSGLVTQGVSLRINSVSRSPPRSPFPSRASVWEANLMDTQGVSHIIQSPNDLAIRGMWQHVAFTYDKASGAAVLYFNGNPVTQTNLGSFTPQTAADLNFGYDATGPIPPWPGDRYPGGALDEVSLYARALSAAEIRALMLSRGTGKSREPPVILSQPVGLRTNVGASVTLGVSAGGNPILKYQWRRNGVTLPGATDPALVLTNLQLAQVGSYSVRVTNAFGVALSSNAVLTLNRFPIADASATVPQAIAPLRCDATVALDGSRSSDPDSDPLRYFWFQAGGGSLFATGMVAVVSLPPGVHPFILVVDDGMATNSQSFTVEVLTLAQAVERLIARVNSQAPRPQPLVASLSAALSSINRSAPTPAINQLQAFQNKTRAQVAPADPALALTFIQTAQQLIVVLSTDCSPARLPVKISKIACQANGKLRVQFNALPGFVYVVEASTNLVDWEKIGVATDGGWGEFDFEDAAAARVPNRFYRLVVP